MAENGINIMKLVFALVLFFMLSIGYDQNNWKLIYENDAQGNLLNGNLEELIMSIQNGQKVRIYYTSKRANKINNYVEHVFDAKALTIMNSSGEQFVMAQIDPIKGQTLNYNDGHVTLKENLEWSLIVSTSGKNDTMMRNIVTGEIVSHSVFQWGIKWFVETKNK